MTRDLRFDGALLKNRALLVLAVLGVSSPLFAQETPPAPAAEPKAPVAEQPSSPAPPPEPADGTPPAKPDASAEPASGEGKETTPQQTTEAETSAPEVAAASQSYQGSAAEVGQDETKQDGYEGSAVPMADASALEPDKGYKHHGKNAPFIIGVLYDTGLPVGNTADFNNNFSGRGFSVEARYRGFKNLRLGGTLSFQDFQDKRDTTFTSGSATLGGVTVRESAFSTLVANAGFVWTGNEGVLPYVRFGLGVSRLWRRIDVGVRRYQTETYHLALVPEIGIEIPLPRFIALAAIRYNYLAASGGVDSQGYLNFSVGIGFE